MSKIRVLVLPSDRTGVGKFRSVEPHIFLQNQNPDDFHVDIDSTQKLMMITFGKVMIWFIFIEQSLKIMIVHRP